MGSTNSVIYENCDEGLQSMMLAKLKEYSKKYTSLQSVYVNRHSREKKEYNYIKINNAKETIKIIFKTKAEFIHLVGKLGRPFIIMHGDYNYTNICLNIYFVFGLHIEQNKYDNVINNDVNNT
jgi:hypothetical protein